MPSHSYNISVLLLFFFSYLINQNTLIHVIQSFLLERSWFVFFALPIKEDQMDTDVSFNVIHSFFCLCCRKHLVAEIAFYNNSQADNELPIKNGEQTNKKNRVLPRKFPFEFSEHLPLLIVSLKDL